jgi:hypothetical protein
MRAGSGRRWAASAVLTGTAALGLFTASPASAQVATTCTTDTTTTLCQSPSAATHDDVHELEQETLAAGALIIFAGFAVLVGSWRRSS